MLLVDTLPELGTELERLLIKAQQSELAAQVSKLTILDRCRCGDDFCASFYTQPKPAGRYGPGLRTIDLDASDGMLILDVVAGTIAHVEVLYRDGIRNKLIAHFP